ncbi:MAG: HTTM domain-containing protein [Planctomycetaceae bacterium]|nr:HTTM domain-containing protein [Planctomycetaceae bacterium]
MIATRILRGWTPFFFTPLDARPLALFRMLSGLLCTCMFLASAANWNRFFAADGIISLRSTELQNTRVNESLGLFYWTEGIVPIGFWWFVCVAFSIMFMVGWKTRWATVGLYVMIEAMLHRNPYLANGEEMVMRMCLLYLVFADPGAVWSVDARLRRRKGMVRPYLLPGWPIRMMQINVALIYVISLPYKLVQDPGWVTGDAIHWTVASDMWGPSEYPFITLAFNGLLRKLITFGTVIVEAWFPLCVWFGRTRRSAIISIAALHLGIAVMIPNVTYFTLSMVCTFPAFLAAEDIDLMDRAWCRLRRFFRSRERSLLPAHRRMAQPLADPARASSGLSASTRS